MRKRDFLTGKKGAVEWDTLIPWFIAALVVILTVIIFMTMNDTMREKVIALKELWSFGRG